MRLSIEKIILIVLSFLVVLESGGQTALVDHLTQVFPKDLYVVENQDTAYVWVFGSANVAMINIDTTFSCYCDGVVGIKFIIDKRDRSIQYDTTIILDTIELAISDLDIFSWLGSEYFYSQGHGEVYFLGGAKRVVGTGKETRLVRSRGFGLRKVVINEQGIDSIFYFPIFSLPGYEPDGLDTTLVDTNFCLCSRRIDTAGVDIDTSKVNVTQFLSYSALLSDVDYSIYDSAFYLLLLEMYSIHDSSRYNPGGHKEIFRIVVIKSQPGNLSVVYRGEWNIADPLMFGYEKGWYVDLAEFSLHNINVGKRFVHVGSGGSWWSFGEMPWWVDSFLVDSLIIAPVDSGLFLVVDTNSFTGHMAFGYLYVKQGQYTIKPHGTFSVYANTGRDTGSWDVLTYPVGAYWEGDSILNMTLTFVVLDSNANVINPYLWLFLSGDTFSRIDLPPIAVLGGSNVVTVSLMLNVATMSVVDFDVVDTKGYWSYVLWDIGETDNVFHGSYLTYELDSPNSINIIRQHLELNSFRQHIRISGRRLVDSGLYMPQSVDAINGPVVTLSDGSMITIVKGFDLRQIMEPNSIVIESIYDGDTIPYGFLQKADYQFPPIYTNSYYMIMLLGCPSIDSSYLLSSVGVEVENCYLAISDSIEYWGITLWDSAYVDFDGSTAISAKFIWEDGCAYDFKFSRSWVDTNFIQSTYSCGVLRVDSFISGGIYHLYSGEGIYIASSDSGVFNITEEGSYWIGREDTNKCKYWYSDTIDVSFARGGFSLSQIISDKGILIVGNEGLKEATLFDNTGVMIDKGILEHVGRCEDKCGGKEIYRYKGGIDHLQKGMYLLEVYDHLGNKGIVKIAVQ